MVVQLLQQLEQRLIGFRQFRRVGERHQRAVVIEQQHDAARLADPRHERRSRPSGHDRAWRRRAIEQVDRARSRGRRADAEATGELGVADRLERAHLLVSRLDEPRLVTGPSPSREQAVDAVARVAENPLDSSLAQAFQHMVGNGHQHHRSFPPQAVKRPLSPWDIPINPACPADHQPGYRPVPARCLWRGAVAVH